MLTHANPKILKVRNLSFAKPLVRESSTSQSQGCQARVLRTSQDAPLALKVLVTMLSTRAGAQRRLRSDAEGSQRNLHAPSDAGG